MRKLSLFSGIGGIDLAAHWAGMETVAFCEREPFPQAVLRKHWPDIPIYDDVCTLTADRLREDGILGDNRTIDIISAGYPCQPFSNAGKRRGEEDDRHLWPEVARLLSEIRPRWFLGENVAGHITLGLDIVLSDLEGIGYTTQTFVIPSAAVNAPHRRDRVFIVGHTERSGCSRQSRRRTEQVTSNGHSQLEEESLSNATSKRLERNAGTKLLGECSGPSLCGQNVAHTKGESSGGLPIREESTDTRPSCGCENVAYSSSSGQQERHATAVTDRAGYGSGGANEGRSHRTAQSRLGGMLNGLSRKLDEHRWPAALGQEQYNWEPPRVATGIKNRVGRLKALGNAVNPHQVYPVLAAIKAINDNL
ncbi:DNA cytosine methyltransferase [Paenibacillus polymyxa]|uniref:DNA cytosine methyltransferase n=1 Tax=Paenibacillus polymyxa TaxID=1406 RepID=UPI002ED0D5B5|nr:DNA cytosine methyltransferase [Paenibacillus polymyxa]